MTEQFANFASSTLANSITATQTTITVNTPQFPFSASGVFRLTVQSFDSNNNPTSNPEIMQVNAVSGNTFTVVRGTESTTAQAFQAGTSVHQTVTAAVMNALASGGGGGGITRSINKVSTNTTGGATASTDYVYLCSGTMTFTLPTASANTNLYTVKNVGSGTVTIGTTSAQTIDGGASLTLGTQYSAFSLISDNTNWNIVS